jgi:hypothetical protein
MAKRIPMESSIPPVELKLKEACKYPVRAATIIPNNMARPPIILETLPETINLPALSSEGEDKYAETAV